MGKEEKRKEGSKSTPRSKCRNSSSSSSSKQMCTSCKVEGRSMFFLLCLDPLFLSHFSVSVFLCARVCSILS